MYVPLYVYSDFSIGSGTASPAELAARAQALGLQALALTDRETLAGQIIFQRACVEQGVSPLCGVELEVEPATTAAGPTARTLVVLARNEAGYSALCRLTSARRCGQRAGLPPSLVAQECADLFILTDNIALARELMELGADLDCSRLLVVRPNGRVSERELLESAKQSGIRVVASPQAIMISQSDEKLQALLFAINRLSGACDALEPLSGKAYPFAHQSVLGRSGSSPSSGEVRAADHTLAERLNTYCLLTRTLNELKFLCMHVTAHPLAVLRQEAQRFGCLDTEAVRQSDGKPVKLAALLAAGRTLFTGSGQVMQFLKLEDECGLLESTFFPDASHGQLELLDNAGPYLFEGVMEGDAQGLHFHILSALPFKERRHPYRADSAGSIISR